MNYRFLNRPLMGTLVVNFVVLSLANPSFALPGVLINSQGANTRIHLHTSPNSKSLVTLFVRPNSRVEILKQETMSDGFTWSYVKLASNGREGWVRSNFVRTEQTGTDSSTASTPTLIPVSVQRGCINLGVLTWQTTAGNVEVVKATVNREGIYTASLRSRQTGQQATCIAEASGKVRQFTPATPTATNPPPSVGNREFGNLEGVGAFSLIPTSIVQGSTASQFNIREFLALVNGRQERWWADCQQGDIGTFNQVSPRTAIALEITNYVCRAPLP